ncbi:hypothetical protein TWF506_000258 [Arthrobotrys conoides]|uniref:Uncharacterized protein n=1 Tax=Arthrobotrys conoides TaxID=74498 RepID=A0AAN8NQK9_9PEZI
MPSSVSSIHTSSSSSSSATVSSIKSDIDHLTPILPYLKLSKSQKGGLTISKNLSKNWEIATDGAIIMALRKERIEKQKREGKERWLKTYSEENPIKVEANEEDEEDQREEVEETFVPCWEREAHSERKVLEPGWLSKILDKG